VESEVPLEVWPACLSLLGIEQVICPPAIRGHDPLKPGGKQLFEPVAVTVLGDPEDRRLRGRGGPHRAVLTGKEPAGLIDVDRPGVQHLARETLVRASEQPRGALTNLIDRADRDRDPEQLAQQLTHVPPRDPVACRQRHDRGLQSRPERGLANGPEPRAGPSGAPWATQPVSAMLDIEHRGRWQLGNLMAPRPVTRNPLTVGELPPAPRALIGVMVNDLRHPVLRQQPATRARVTRLTASLALLGVFPR